MLLDLMQWYGFQQSFRDYEVEFFLRKCKIQLLSASCHVAFVSWVL